MSSLSFFQWMIAAGIFYLLFAAIQGTFGGKGKISPNGNMICQNCGTRGDPQKVTKGSTGIEIVLWLCLLLPGLIYSLWRMSSRYSGCPSCGSKMISVDTPNGRLLIEKLRTIPEQVVVRNTAGDGADML